MPGPFPSANARNPLILPDGAFHEGTVFLKNAIDHPRIDIGDYTYASAHRPPDDWAAHLAPYIYPVSPDKLVIGKFCQIADGVLFVTSSANHRYDGFSSYPFAVFDGGFEESRASLPGPGKDILIGNDVWIGTRATILPGTRLADGVIVGAGAVVGGDIPPYTIVGGNPARPIRQRFAPATVERLIELAWWNWPIELILTQEDAICGGDLAALEQAVKHL